MDADKETVYQRLRNKSLKEYYKSPKYCKHCNGVIWVPEGKSVSSIRKRVFCSDECRKVQIEADSVLTKTINYFNVAKKISEEVTQWPSWKKVGFEIQTRSNDDTLKICTECGEEYNIKMRAGRPGKLTQCEECAEEVEEKYIGNWTPAGASSGKNLHQWEITPTKGEQHISKSSVA